MPVRGAVIGAVLACALAAGAAWWALSGGGPAEGPAPAERPPFVEPPRAPAEPTGPGWFRDVTAGSGLAFAARNGEEAGHAAILESLGTGVALLDYDGDGLLDVFLTGGGHFDAGAPVPRGHPCKLFRNLGNFKFEDTTARAGLDQVDWWYTHGAAVADYDRDGWPDLVVTGYGRIAVFHNEPDGRGGRAFADVTEKLGAKADGWCTSAGWADLDGDGFPDLYVCRYCDWSPANHPRCDALPPATGRDICTPQKFRPLEHLAFRNEKGAALRPWALHPTARGRGLGVILADLNGDARPDVYVANDTDFNFLFFNRGGTFDEVGLVSGAGADEGGHPDGSMGVDVGDYDGSGRPAIWVTNFDGEANALYRNLGRESFLHQSRAAGVTAHGLRYVGFGTAFVDADNDGWEDLLALNGHVFGKVAPERRRQRPVLLANVDAAGKRHFRPAGTGTEAFFRAPALGRGLAVGDLNNDGWPDAIAVHTNAPVAVLQNVAAEHAKANWVGFQLVGRGNRDTVGAAVTIESGGRALVRFTKGGGSYMSSSDRRVLFGLGTAAAPVRVSVRWSWGEVQTWDGLAPNRYWVLTEGAPAAR